MYSGQFKFKEEPETTCHLLVYKDSKIVHTLYPGKKKYNLKTKLNLARGIVTTHTIFPPGHRDLVVPFHNNKGTVLFSILVRRTLWDKMEYLFIRKHDNSGDPAEHFLLSIEQLNNADDFDRGLMHYFQFDDLSQFESVIKEIYTSSFSNI
jgi:hypothetical protein